MGGYYFYSEYHPTKANDSNLFWLTEYLKRNPVRQNMFECRANEFSTEDSIPQDECGEIDRPVYFDDNGLPLFNPMTITDPESVVRQISIGIFSPICDPFLFEETRCTFATLVVKPNGTTSFHIDISDDNEMIVYCVSSLLDYYKGIRKPFAKGKLTIEMDNTKGNDPVDDHYWITSLHTIKAGLRARLKARDGKDAPRALGLWLWDYIKQHDGTIIAAIRAMKEQLGAEIITLGFADSEESVFRRFHRKTAECIDACEVLPFK